MKKCSACKIELNLFSLKYKRKFNQYLCTKCNTTYLEANIGLINKAIIVNVGMLMNNKKFKNLLNRLGE